MVAHVEEGLGGEEGLGEEGHGGLGVEWFVLAHDEGRVPRRVGAVRVLRLLPEARRDPRGLGLGGGGSAAGNVGLAQAADVEGSEDRLDLG